MSILLVWILIGTEGNYAGWQIGPNYADQASCERVRGSLARGYIAKCIQVNVPGNKP
jgi:hypothetical protein